MTVKTIDIFIKSYHKDFWLLQIALKSIAKNVTGYNRIILLIPELEKELFDTRDMPPRTLIHYVPEYGNGYLYQQVCKINAHKYSHADYIMFGDSDCIFTRPINLQDYITDDKPEILYTSWDKVGDAIVWREPTEKFLKESAPYEMMRRNGLIYHRDTLEEIAKFAPDLESTIMQSNRFSEFNCMSAFAYKYQRDRYNFVNTDDWTYTEPKSTQLWSHANKNGSEVHKDEWIRTLETIVKTFGINLPE
jgi:hypothetical protein